MRRLILSIGVSLLLSAATIAGEIPSVPVAPPPPAEGIGVSDSRTDTLDVMSFDLARSSLGLVQTVLSLM